MTRPTIDFGIDLGTTNSAIALRGDENVEVVPSVVRVTADGRRQVGHEARALLGVDPDNTHAEFKRLMGTTTKLRFAASGLEQTPEELSAEVLKALRRWAELRFDEPIDAAVITVPALFEIPQNEATERAATLAGIKLAPLLQEPIAAALAYGFGGGADQGRAFWLVYDFGGGTFDASIVSLREGRLTVVDHDGDNFLGGKDLDRRLLDLVTDRGRRDLGIAALDAGHRDHGSLLAALRPTVERARIDLSSQRTAQIHLPELARDDADRPVDDPVEVRREELERVIVPEISRSVDICERLLDRNRLGSADVGRVVLVGGVTRTPLVRRLLAERLGIELEAGLDPAKTVAIGASLHAASVRRPTVAIQVPAGALALRLEHPAVSQDLAPYLVGRFLDGEAGAALPEWVEITRDDGGWSSGRLPLSDQRAFLTPLQIRERETTRFDIAARRGDGTPVTIAPCSIQISHGLAVAAPPLSRSLGVGLADNGVHVYLPKGTSLPAQASHLLRTTTALEPGRPGAVVDVPVVQGESERADRNRHVGTLCIPATRIRRALPRGSEVEVTVDVDQSATVRARAYVPFLDQIFEQVLSTRLVPATAAELEADLELAFRRRSRLEESPEGAVLVAEIGEEAFDDVIRDIAAASLSDPDAALRAQRRLLELHERLDRAELDVKWPLQVSRAHRAKVSTHGAVTEHGSAADRELCAGLDAEVSRAIAARDLLLLERKTSALWRLRHRVLSRRPEYWIDIFWWLERRQGSTTDPQRAARLVEEGQAAIDRQDWAALERITLDLDALVAPDEEDRPLGLRSHVR